MPGRRDPLGVGVGREEPGLLFVGAERRGDHEVDTIRARSRVHAVEGERDVGAHRLALAKRERPPVFPLAQRFDRQRVRGHELRLGDLLGPHGGASSTDTDPHRVVDGDPNADGRDRVGAGERDRDRARAVRARRALRGLPAEGEVGVAL
jgi:hypothetical protein